MKGENIQRVIAGREQQVPLVCLSAALLDARVCFGVIRECASNYVRQVHLSNLTEIGGWGWESITHPGVLKLKKILFFNCTTSCFCCHTFGCVERWCSFTTFQAK